MGSRELGGGGVGVNGRKWPFNWLHKLVWPHFGCDPAISRKIARVWREPVRDRTAQLNSPSPDTSGLIAMRQALQSPSRRLQVFRPRTTAGVE